MGNVRNAVRSFRVKDMCSGWFAAVHSVFAFAVDSTRRECANGRDWRRSGDGVPELELSADLWVIDTNS